MLVLSDMKFKNNYMLSAFVEEIDNIQEQRGNVSRKVEILNKIKGNSKNLKLYNRNEECFR